MIYSSRHNLYLDAAKVRQFPDICAKDGNFSAYGVQKEKYPFSRSGVPPERKGYATLTFFSSLSRKLYT